MRAWGARDLSSILSTPTIKTTAFAVVFGYNVAATNPLKTRCNLPNCPVCRKNVPAPTEVDVEIVVMVGESEYRFLVSGLAIHMGMAHGCAFYSAFVDAINMGEISDTIVADRFADETEEEFLAWYQAQGYSLVGYPNGEYPPEPVDKNFLIKLGGILQNAEGRTSVI